MSNTETAETTGMVYELHHKPNPKNAVHEVLIAEYLELLEKEESSYIIDGDLSELICKLASMGGNVRYIELLTSIKRIFHTLIPYEHNAGVFEK